MSFTHTVPWGIQTPEGTLSNPVTSTGSQAQAIDDSIPDSTTDQLVTVAFTLATLKSFYFVCDQNVQIETNATDHTGGDLISVLANVPLQWQSGGYLTNPFTADVTEIYLTTGVVGTASYSIRVLQDGTP